MVPPREKRTSVGKSLLGVVKAASVPKLVIPALAMLVYVVLVIWSLYVLGIWNVSVLKETIVWFFAALFVTFQLATSDRDKNIWAEFVADSVKILFVVQFILENYTFAFWKEMLIVPFITFVLLLNTVASTKPEAKQVSKFLTLIQALFGFAILFFAVSAAIADYRNLGSLSTIRSLLIVPILSVAQVPFIYALRLYANYELLFNNLNIGFKKTRELKRYARRRFIVHFGINNIKILSFIRNPKRRELYQVKSKEDVDRVLAND